MIGALLSVLQMGLIWALVVMSVWITSVLLRYDDISIQASFGFAGAVTARLLVLGMPALCTPFVGLCAGAIVGLATGLLHAGLRLNSLMSSIIVTTGFFSLTLLVGGANMPIANVPTIYTYLPTLPVVGNKTILLLAIASAVYLIISWLLGTQLGFMLQAVGSNPSLVVRLAKRPGLYKVIALCLAHSVVGLAGALFVQYTGFFSLWSSVGILVIAFAGLLIAFMIKKGFGIHLIIGACLYQAIIAVTYYFYLPPTYNKLVTALLIIGLLLLQRRSDVTTA